MGSSDLTGRIACDLFGIERNPKPVECIENPVHPLDAALFELFTGIPEHIGRRRDPESQNMLMADIRADFDAA